jgi:soluble lytic murein transglycosylase-like protein
MDNAALFALAAVGLVALAAAGKPTLSVPGQALSLTEVQSLASATVQQHFAGRVDPAMLWRIAWVESSFNPTAIRAEIAIGDASLGLMQTLLSTATWLHEIGYTAYPAPTFAELFRPEVSMYFGAAYIDYLAHRNGLTSGKGEETIVRAYNGGPGGATRDYTAGYWAKYQAARERFN